MGVIFLKFLVGAAAGFLAWAIMEPFAPTLASAQWGAWEGTTILFLGALIGGSTGALDGWTRGGKVHLLRGLLLGALFGAIGASLGSSIGSALSTGMFGGSALIDPTAGMARQMLARIVALTPIGVFLGAAVGLSGMNFKKAIQGATGGAIGAAAAAAMFDPIGRTLQDSILRAQGAAQGEVGGPSRALLFVTMGALIALFIGLVERLSRSAWVRLNLGRNEGKEWAIDSAQTFIGRSESAQIPLFGDPSVAPLHASIQRQSGQYVLIDGGSPIGTTLNGYRVGPPATLSPGSVIGIGSFQLQFLMRNVPVPQSGPEMYPGQIYRPAPQPYSPAPVAGGMPTTAFPAAPAPVAAATIIAAPSGGFALRALDGPLSGRQFPLAAPIELGRESATVPMAYDGNASRRHAAVSPSGFAVSVSDLGSTNGTFLNGQRVQHAMANVGDILKVGATSFRIESV